MSDFCKESVMLFLAISQKLLMETLWMLACSYVKEERCSSFFFDCSVEDANTALCAVVLW